MYVCVCVCVRACVPAHSLLVAFAAAIGFSMNEQHGAERPRF